MSDNLGEAIKAAYDQVVNDVPPPQDHEENPTNETPSNEGVDTTDTNSSSPTIEIEAPSHWANDDRVVFNSLDVKGREFLLRRHKQMEADHTKKLQAHAEDVKIAENYRKRLTPHEGYIKNIGIDPMDAFEKLVGAEIKLRTGSPQEKQQILFTLAKQYGIPFEANETQPEIDEKTQFILQKLEKQEAMVLQLKKEREIEERHGLQNHISNFTSQVDETGNPKYPHFETVKARMGKFLEDGEAKSLEEAYELAIWLNKDLRTSQVLSQNKPIEAKKKTLSSKDATFNVRSGSTSKISDPKEDLSLEQAIRRSLNAQKTKRI